MQGRSDRLVRQPRPAPPAPRVHAASAVPAETSPPHVGVLILRARAWSIAAAPFRQSIPRRTALDEVDRAGFIARTASGTSPWPVMMITARWGTRPRPFLEFESVHVRHAYVGHQAARRGAVASGEKIARGGEGRRLEAIGHEQRRQRLTDRLVVVDTNTFCSRSFSSPLPLRHRGTGSVKLNTVRPRIGSGAHPAAVTIDDRAADRSPSPCLSAWS